MSDNPTQPGDVAGADDLTRIGGIGSKIAERLYAAGILTYADLASRSAGAIIKLLPDVSGLSTARLDGWRDQARELAAAAEGASAPQAATSQTAPPVPAGLIPAGPVPAGPVPAGPVPAGPVPAGPVPAGPVPAGPVLAGAPDNGQHYESFLVRVLLNDDGSIRRMTAQHVRTGAERRWPGLDREALPDFIRTAITSATPASEAPAGSPSEQAQPAEAAPARAAEPRPAEVRGAPAGPRRAGLSSSAVLSVKPVTLRAAEPFTLTMTIDLAEPASHADRLAYSAVIVARPMAGGPKQTVAQSDGFLATPSSAITIGAAGLPPGAYRLDGAVSLREPGLDHPVHLAAMAEGLLVRVLPR